MPAARRLTPKTNAKRLAPRQMALPGRYNWLPGLVAEISRTLVMLAICLVVMAMLFILF